MLPDIFSRSRFPPSAALALAALALGLALLLGPACASDAQTGDQFGDSLATSKLTASDAEAYDTFGISVAVSGDTAVVGAWFEDAGGRNAGAAYIFRRDHGGTDSWGQVKKLAASDAQAGDQFGFSVAVSGDTAVVGASGEDAGGTQLGAAYIFRRDHGGTDSWGQVKKLSASDARAGDQFGFRVAVSGDTAVVGASGEDGRGSNAGAAYVFQRDQGGTDNWGQIKKLSASDAQAGDRLGISVAVSDDTAVVGAYLEDAGGTQLGAAYIFRRDQGGTDNWGQVKKLTASDAQVGDWFGISVAVSGDIAVVGAYLEDAGGTQVEAAYGRNAGAAYIFRRDQGGAGNWGQVKKLAASDAHAGDQFGFSVAVSGDTAVVGANLEGAGGINAGAAYAFRRNQGGADNWSEVKKLTAFDAHAGDQFGFSVAVSGDTAVVGAWVEDAAGSNAGAAYIASTGDRDEAAAMGRDRSLVSGGLGVSPQHRRAAPAHDPHRVGALAALRLPVVRYGVTSSQSVARRDTPVRLTSPLVGGTCSVPLQHRAALPAADPHQVALSPALVQPVMRERMPELLGMYVAEVRLVRAAPDHLGDARIEQPPLSTEPKPPLAGGGSPRAHAQVAVDRSNCLVADWQQALASARAEHTDQSLVEVDIGVQIVIGIVAQPSHFSAPGSRVHEHAQDRVVAPRLEIRTPARRQQPPQLVVTQDWDGLLGDERSLHARHR